MASTISPRLRAVMTKVNKELGPDAVTLGSTYPPIQRCTTGSLSLDVVLQGGWPLNQWSELIGLESSGKTAVALKTIAANQALNPSWTAVWIAAEGWVEQYAVMCGVDTSRVLVVDTNSAEDAFQATLDFAESREVDGVFIDSLPMLSSTAEDEKDMDGFSPGRMAVLTGQFFRKARKATRRASDGTERPVLGLVINQWRDKIGVLHGDPRTTPGGKGKNYAYYVRVDLARDEWLTEGTGNAKRRVGQTIKARVIKNKSGPGEPVAAVDFYNREGAAVPAGQYDIAKEIVSLGILRGVIEQTSAGRYAYEGRKWHGAPALLSSIREEVELAASLDREVRDTISHILPITDMEEPA